MSIWTSVSEPWVPPGGADNETVVQDAAFVQGMLKTIMSLLCRTLRLTMVESKVLKVSRPHTLTPPGAEIPPCQNPCVYTTSTWH